MQYKNIRIKINAMLLVKEDANEHDIYDSLEAIINIINEQHGYVIRLGIDDDVELDS